MSVRISVVTDIHHGGRSLTKRGDAALGLLDEFCRFSADAGADIALDLGDRISDVDPATDARLQREVADALGPVRPRLRHINGNHDRDHLSVEENEAIFGQPMASETVDLGAWRIVVWRADARIVRNDGYRGFVLHEADLLWLARTIARADRPLLVVSHVPISGHSQTGNYYFENNPAYATYPMAERARRVLAAARVPVVCLAGHVHWNTVTPVDGIVHLTQQSLTESFTTGGEPAGAFGLLELDDQVRWRVLGRDPIEFSFRPVDARWTPPLPPFGEHPEMRVRHAQHTSGR